MSATWHLAALQSFHPAFDHKGEFHGVLQSPSFLHALVQAELQQKEFRSFNGFRVIRLNEMYEVTFPEPLPSSLLPHLSLCRGERPATPSSVFLKGFKKKNEFGPE